MWIVRVAQVNRIAALWLDVGDVVPKPGVRRSVGRRRDDLPGLYREPPRNKTSTVDGVGDVAAAAARAHGVDPVASPDLERDGLHRRRGRRRGRWRGRRRWGLHGGPGCRRTPAGALL